MEERKNQQPTQDGRPQYSPPQALRLGQVAGGLGQNCGGPGSGAMGCETGNGANSCSPGSSAQGSCSAGDSHS